MTSRETFLNISDQVVAAPGPGHYDPRFAQDIIKVKLELKGFMSPQLKSLHARAKNLGHL